MASPPSPAALTFHGHACFGLALPDGTHLCIDPVPAAGFAGHSNLQGLPDLFTHAWASHAHADHSAFHEVPSARPIVVSEGGLALGAHLKLDHRLAPHDEYGGRLRGGLSAVLRATVTLPGQPTLRLVFAGDLGEVPSGALLAWLRATPIDVLVLPVGGYYVLSPQAALETTYLVRPGAVVPVHARDQGIPLPVMAPVADFVRHWPSVVRHDALDLRSLLHAPVAPTVCRLLTPRAVLVSDGYAEPARA